MDEQDKKAAAKHATRAATQAKHAAKNVGKAAATAAEAVAEDVNDAIENTAEEVIDKAKVVSQANSLRIFATSKTGLLTAGAVAGIVAYVGVKVSERMAPKPVDARDLATDQHMKLRQPPAA